jgi:hypothetical protein
MEIRLRYDERMLRSNIVDGGEVPGFESRQRKTASTSFEAQALAADADIDFAPFR